MENTEVVIYRSGDGSVSVEALVDSSNETIWATQKSMADLFGVGVNTINHHIKSIYKCAELQVDRTIRKNRIVRMEGKRRVVREVEFYNLGSYGSCIIMASCATLTIPKGFPMRH